MASLISEIPQSEVNATLELFDRLGVTREGLKNFRKAPSSVQVAVARLMQGDSNSSSEIVLTIDYGMSLTDMIDAGGYDWTNSDVTAKRFPVSGSGKVEISAELVHFDRNITSDDAVKGMVKRGLRPATFAELLAFGAKYPEDQRKFPVVALGSSAEVHGNLSVPCLYGSDAERSLHLGWCDGGWRGHFRFLAVRN